MTLHDLPEEEKNKLDAEAFRVAQLIAGFLRGTLPPAEHEELDRWVEASDRNMELFEELTEEDNVSDTLQWADSLRAKCRRSSGRYVASGPLRRYVLPVAAVLFLVLGATWWLYPFSSPHRVQRTAGTFAVRPSADSLQAVLILDDRTAVPLPLYRDTAFEAEGVRHLVAGPEGLSYRNAGTSSLPAPEHALRTPRRQTCRLTLSDGTRVWMNGASQLTYPAVFSGATREVHLKGEAWFEVTRDPAHPFIVRTESVTLRVLGTSFNVEAYTPQVTATLLEGRLRVRGAKDSADLDPGEQLVALPSGKWRKHPETDLDAALAWQSGLFVFRDASIGTVLSQLARWYDVNVCCTDTIPFHFTATLPRSLPLERVLAILELTGRVRFHLEGRTLSAERTEGNQP